MLGPFDFIFLFQGPDHIDKGGVESFTVAITLGMVTSSPQFGNFGNSTKFSKEKSLK